MKKFDVARLAVLSTILAACAQEPSRSSESRAKAVSNTPAGANSQATSTNTALKTGTTQDPSAPSLENTTQIPNGPEIFWPAAGTGMPSSEPMAGGQPSTPGNNPSMEPMIVVSDAEIATGPSIPPTSPASNPSTPPSNPSTPTPDPKALAVFKKGDAFVPKASTLSQMVAALVESQKYAEAKSPKAIAINAKGLGMVAVLSTLASPADAKRAALEGCYVIGGFQPCTILVLGDTYEVDSLGLSNPATYSESLATPRALTDVPFIDPAQADLMITDYQKTKTAKAIAISLDGIKVAVTETDLDSVEEAIRLALQRCELAAKLVPCFLFATQDDITFSPKTAPWNLSFAFDGVEIRTKGAQAPGVSNHQLNELTDGINTYTDRVSQDKSGNGLVYLSILSGNLGWSTPSYNLLPGKDYKASAKARCEAFDGPGTCVEVIDKTKVSLSPAQLPSSMNNFALAHCKAMPRASCDAHKAAGCKDSGDYYLFNKTAIELKPCSF